MERSPISREVFQDLLHCWTVMKMRGHYILEVLVVYSATYCNWILFSTSFFENDHNGKMQVLSVYTYYMFIFI